MSATPKEGIFIGKNSRGFCGAIPEDLIRECLLYDQDSGVLTWRLRPISHFKNAHGMNIWNSQHAGMEAGSIRHDGITVSINFRPYRAHRLCWVLAGHQDPGPSLIDHINGNPFDNRLSNLRLADSSQNNENSRVRSHCKSGLKGVYWHPRAGKWASAIRHRGKSEWLGLHLTKGLAAVARAKAALRAHGAFAKVN